MGKNNTGLKFALRALVYLLHHFLIFFIYGRSIYTGMLVLVGGSAVWQFGETLST
jgi:hypothetical protein